MESGTVLVLGSCGSWSDRALKKQKMHTMNLILQPLAHCNRLTVLKAPT